MDSSLAPRDEARRYASNYHARFNIVGDDCSGRHDGTGSDSNIRYDHNIGAQPNIVFHDDAPSRMSLLVDGLVQNTEPMAARAPHYIGTNQDIVTNNDLAIVRGIYG